MFKTFSVIIFVCVVVSKICVSQGQRVSKNMLCNFQYILVVCCFSVLTGKHVIALLEMHMMQGSCI